MHMMTHTEVRAQMERVREQLLVLELAKERRARSGGRRSGSIRRSCC